ncbi:hypothetical protein [uncultured Erythrobacter sp.]|uniref:hypothetical protein n=1 Tax=uncultured Erythrobacter sp. TaxID=263913 RepID=UPI002626A9F6|nr:hypothetical protein [uncultured Erythrobacter sp.]
MSELRRFSRPLANSAPLQTAPSRFAGLRQRLPYYVAAVVLALLALAWIDGGEEPIRPIVQPVEATGQN